MAGASYINYRMIKLGTGTLYMREVIELEYNQNYRRNLFPIVGIRITLLSTSSRNIMKRRLFKYIENFTTKNSKFSDKFFFIFLLKTGGCNEYPQAMFLSRHKKNIVYPCKPSFII